MLSIYRISLEEANKIIEEAIKKSKEIGVPMCIAVADESGNLVAFSRMDNAKITSIDIAINKAFTAAAAKRSTRDYNEIAVPGKSTFGINTTNNCRFTIIPGGLPIIFENQVIGGIGVSGGTAEQDEVVASFALERFNKLLIQGTKHGE